VLYAQRLAIASSRALWSEYRVPFYGPWRRPETPEPSSIVLRDVAMTRGGVPAGEPAEIARIPRMTMPGDLPAADLTALPIPGGGALALWSEADAIMAMPLDRNYVRAGGARQIGKAMNGTLRVVRTNAGALLVYARRENGSSRIFFRREQPRSARKTRGTSARPDSR